MLLETQSRPLLFPNQPETEFTPPSLRALDRAPVFRFKARDPRDADLFAHFTTSNGLEAIAEGEIRAAIFGILTSRWPPETFAEQYPQLSELWGRIDRGEMLAPAEQGAVRDLVDRCREVSPHLNWLISRNDQFRREAPTFALAFTLKGWRNLETPFVLQAGYLSWDALGPLVDELHAIEEAAAATSIAGVVPGLALMELAAHAISFVTGSSEQPLDPVGEAA